VEIKGRKGVFRAWNFKVRRVIGWCRFLSVRNARHCPSMGSGRQVNDLLVRGVSWRKDFLREARRLAAKGVSP
jgi:hypothetical protein